MPVVNASPAHRPVPTVANANANANASTKIEFVTAANFQSKVLQARGPVVVEFMSFACGHCRRMEPVIHNVAKELAGEVTVFKVNVPVERALASQFGITGTPTFVMFEGGNQVKTAFAPPEAGALKHIIRNAFAS